MRKLTLLLVVGLMLAASMSAWADVNAQQNVDMEIPGICEFAINTPGIVVLDVDNPGFGQQPQADVDSTTKYSMTTNLSGTKLTMYMDMNNTGTLDVIPDGHLTVSFADPKDGVTNYSPVNVITPNPIWEPAYNGEGEYIGDNFLGWDNTSHTTVIESISPVAVSNKTVTYTLYPWVADGMQFNESTVRLVYTLEQQ